MNTSFFQADRVTELSAERVRGFKALTSGEALARGAAHYPQTLVLESLAQLGGLLAEKAGDTGQRPPLRAVLSQIRRAKLEPGAAAGEGLELECRLGSLLGTAVLIEGEAKVRGVTVASADFTFTLHDIAEPEVHAQREALYKVWTKGL